MAADHRLIGRILRVDQAGEYGAIRIYRAQLAIARWRAPELQSFLVDTLSHEMAHEQKLLALMPPRGIRPCRSLWLWGWGGSALGAVTVLFGPNAILACTAAVERTVHGHLKDQIAVTAKADPELHQALREIMAEEVAHLTFAEQGLAPTMMASSLQRLVAAATELLIWLSTQGDSGRHGDDLKRQRKRAEP